MLCSTKSVDSGNGSSVPRIVWKTPAVKQKFSLPEPIVRYIAMNPTSPEGYLKLISSCKYFFECKPVLVLGKFIKSNVESDALVCIHDCYESNGCDSCSRFDLQKNPIEIWYTGYCEFVGSSICLGQVHDITKFVDDFIYKSDATDVALTNVEVDYDQFVKLCKNCKKLVLHGVNLRHSNGVPVMLQDIFRVIPKLEVLHLTRGEFNCYNRETFRDLIEEVDFSSLKEICLWSVPEDIVVRDLIELVITKLEHVTLNLNFCTSASTSAFHVQQLGNLVDAIIESDVTERRISYDGQDRSKYLYLCYNCS